LERGGPRVAANTGCGAQSSTRPPKLDKLTLKSSGGTSTVITITGCTIAVWPEGTIEVTEEEAKPLIANAGFVPSSASPKISGPLGAVRLVQNVPISDFASGNPGSKGRCRIAAQRAVPWPLRGRTGSSVD